MEEQKENLATKKHATDCGCEACFKCKKGEQTKKMVIAAAVLVVVFAAGFLLGRLSNGNNYMKNRRNFNVGNFPTGMQGGNFQRTGGMNRTGANGIRPLENQTQGQTAPTPTQTQPAAGGQATAPTAVAPATTQPAQ